MRSWWREYRCINQSPGLRTPISLLGRNAGYCAIPFYEGFIALQMALQSEGYVNCQSIWIPRACPAGIGGRACQADGTSCSIHNYGVAVDIDAFGFGNDHFQRPYGDRWGFSDCKITLLQVEAVERIKNTDGETMFRWLGWAIGDTMHFEGQVPPTRTKVDWSTVGDGEDGRDDSMTAAEFAARLSIEQVRAICAQAGPGGVWVISPTDPNRTAVVNYYLSILNNPSSPDWVPFYHEVQAEAMVNSAIRQAAPAGGGTTVIAQKPITLTGKLSGTLTGSFTGEGKPK